MDRRELLKFIGAATGAAFVGNALAWTPVPSATPLKAAGFSAEDLAYLNDIADCIIPRTDTPGAKDADVGRIMAIWVADCYLPAEQALFKQGMTQINSEAQSRFGKPFLLLDNAQRHSLLSGLNEAAYQYNRENQIDHWELGRPGGRPDQPRPLPHYFTLFKQLTLLGFFTSEIGATKVLRYVAVPGRYDGEFPYQKGDKAWAT